MCAIIDNNVLHESFGERRSPAGHGFREWLDRAGSLVIGGKLTQELNHSLAFRNWCSQATLAGRVREINDDAVNSLEAKLNAAADLKSNDAHVIALAQLGGARLLFSNDSALHEDFKNRALVNGGKVYSTQQGGEFRDSHRSLLRANVCPRRRGDRHGPTS